MSESFSIRSGRLFGLSGWLRLVLPTVCTLALIFVAIFFIHFPAIRSSLLEQKREAIRDQAQTMVNVLQQFHGLELAGEMSREQAQNLAKAFVSAVRYGREQRNYFWINDYRAVIVAHPYMPQIVGQDLSNFEDKTGKKLVREMVNATEATGSAYVTYFWQWQDDPDQIVPKISYVQRFEPWGWIVGTGVYLEDLEAEARADIKDLALVTGGIILLALLLSAYAVWQGRATVLELRESEARFRNVFDQSHQFVGLLDTAGRIVIINQTAMDYVGMAEEDVVGTYFWDGPWWQTDEKQKEWLRNAVPKVAGGETVRAEVVHRNEKDELKYFDFTLKPGRDSRGRILFLIPEGRDITERKHAEETLRSSEERYRVLAEKTNQIVYDMDLTAMTMTFSGAVESVLGESEDFPRVLHRDDWVSRIHPDDIEGAMARIRRVLEEKTDHESQYRVRRADGIYIHIENSGTRLCDENGENCHIVGTIKDVTERVETQDMLMQTEKMASVGGLAAGMAHEINNPLGVIVQGVQSARRRVSDGIEDNAAAARDCGVELEQVRAYLDRRGVLEYLDGIREAGLRAAEIVRSMLEFSRRTESGRADHQINEIVDKAIQLVSSDYDLKKKFDFRRVTVERDFTDNLPLVSVSATQIEQVLLNLVKNAAQAMYDKKYDPDEKPRIVIRTRLGEDRVVVEVEDNGPGMEDAVRKRIFEPFYTTKPVGSGTGLGLSVSYFIIVEKHGGQFFVRSDHGKGTCFVLHLPLASTRRSA